MIVVFVSFVLLVGGNSKMEEYVLSTSSTFFTMWHLSQQSMVPTMAAARSAGTSPW
jgi:hypothetical protein